MQFTDPCHDGNTICGQNENSTAKLHNVCHKLLEKDVETEYDDYFDLFK